VDGPLIAGQSPLPVPMSGPAQGAATTEARGTGHGTRDAGRVAFTRGCAVLEARPPRHATSPPRPDVDVRLPRVTGNGEGPACRQMQWSASERHGSGPAGAGGGPFSHWEEAMTPSMSDQTVESLGGPGSVLVPESHDHHLVRTCATKRTSVSRSCPTRATRESCGSWAGPRGFTAPSTSARLPASSRQRPVCSAVVAAEPSPRSAGGRRRGAPRIAGVAERLSSDRRGKVPRPAAGLRLRAVRHAQQRADDS
jgi:hypothetical protein